MLHYYCDTYKYLHTFVCATTVNLVIQHQIILEILRNDHIMAQCMHWCVPQLRQLAVLMAHTAVSYAALLYHYR
jgi:hypothetical protein